MYHKHTRKDTHMNLNPLRHSRALIIGSLFMLGITPLAQSGPGDLGVRFGTHGQAQIPGQVDSAALIALPDGRILVFGVAENLSARDEGAIGVARLLANGQPDAAFTPGGHLNLRLGGDAWPVPTDALLLADGRILLAGYFAGNEVRQWPRDQPRSRVPGWLVRISSDGVLDPAFGIGGLVRAGEWGIDRIALLPDGAIVSAAPGRLHRLDPNGIPELFPGSQEFTVPLGSGYPMSAMAVMQDGSLVTSAGFTGGYDGSETFHRREVSRVSPSGVVTANWARPSLFDEDLVNVGAFADSNGTSLLACSRVSGWGGTSVLVQRWLDDGKTDRSFAPAGNGRIDLGMSTEGERSPQCRNVLRGVEGDYFVIGDWSNLYQYGGGRVLLAHFDAFGVLDTEFDPSRRGRELALGTPEQWSSWYVPDAAIASDGNVLLIARRSSALNPNHAYSVNTLGEQRTVIARVEGSRLHGVGSIGFNDAALRIAERRAGELRVYRTGGAAGSISVRYQLAHDTTNETDVGPYTGRLIWPDGDASPRTIPLVPVDDDAVEGEERFRVRLSEATGGAGLGVPEIEVTIEDDEALRALQFVGPTPDRIQEGGSVEVSITRPAATPGPIIARYATTAYINKEDGTPRLVDPRRVSQSAGDLRWSADDTSSRTLRVSTVRDYNSWGPDTTMFVALADVSGTLRDGDDWKVARFTVSDGPVQSQPTSTTSPRTVTPTPGGNSGGGGGAVSFEILALIALALLFRWAGRSRPRSVADAARAARS
jgi:hypothetical protein